MGPEVAERQQQVPMGQDDFPASTNYLGLQMETWLAVVWYSWVAASIGSPLCQPSFQSLKEKNH